MAVNLTLIASETLNEIILHHLQNESLVSAERIEQSFYRAFENTLNAPDEELFFEDESSANTDISKALVGKEYVFIYKAAGNETTVLNICHVSRNP